MTRSERRASKADFAGVSPPANRFEVRTFERMLDLFVVRAPAKVVVRPTDIGPVKQFLRRTTSRSGAS